MQTTLGTLASNQLTTGAEGKATTQLTSTTEGTATVTATCAGLSANTTVTFVPPSTPPTLEVTANPSSLPADGQSTSTITASYHNANGAPIAGAMITFTTTSGAVAPTTATTNEQGQATTTLTASNQPGTATVTASCGDVQGTTTVTFTQPGGTPATLTLAAQPTAVPADGQSQSTISATVVDQTTGQPSIGTVVDFETTAGTLSAANAVTNDAGIATVTLTSSTTAGTAVVAGRVGVNNHSVNVVFTEQGGGNQPPTAVHLNDPTNVTDTSLDLTWTQNADTDFAKYEVHKSLTDGFTPDDTTKVATITEQMTTTYHVADLANVTTYYWKVGVVDTGNLTADSNQVKATAAPPPPPPPPQHHHNWVAGVNNDPPLIIQKEYVRCGEVIRIDVAGNLEHDECTVTSPPCSFTDNKAANDTIVIGWDDGDAEGAFGHLDGNQNFVPGSPITHYRASPEKAGVVHLRAILDDIPKALDPATGEEIQTFDDQPWHTTGDPWESPENGRITVWEFTISDSCGDDWAPRLDTDLTYTADIDPTYDHHDNLMEGIIEFSLAGVSQEPGYCLNATRMDTIWTPHEWTHTGSADIDLKFFPEDQQPSPLDVWSSCGLFGHSDNYDQAATLEPVNIAQAKLRCFDYGAYGRVSARASGLPFTEGGPVTARLKDTLPADNIFWDDIPTDKQPVGGNKVADVWDSTHGAKAGNWDEENDPQTGDNPDHDNFKGDGYPYYEEYRGLEVDGAWTVMRPDKKEVFVCDLDKKPGATGYYGASDLTIYVSHTEGEMTADNVVNMYRDTGNPYIHLGAAQHGLRLVDVSDDSAYDDYFGLAEGEPNPGPPRTRTRICINHQFCDDVWGMQQFTNQVIAHELGHGSNLWHHGDSAGWWFAHDTGAAVVPEPVQLPPYPYPNHYADPLTGMAYGADPYDGDSCIMQYLCPWPGAPGGRPVAAIPTSYCTTAGTVAAGIPNANHERCKWHIDVRDAPRQP